MYCLIVLNRNVPAFCTYDKKYFFLELDTVKQKCKKYKIGNVMEEFDSSKLRDKTPVLLEDKDAEIIEERNYVIENDFITLFNAFFWPSRYHVERMDVKISKIKFKDRYYKIGSYNIRGMWEIQERGDSIVASDVTVWGNPMVEINYAKRDPDYTYDFEREINYCKEDRFSSIASGCLCEYESEDEMRNDKLETILSENTISELLEDIPGEAG